MRENDINMVEFAKIVGMTESRAYYYLNKFGFTFRDGIHNDKSPEEIIKLVWSSLTGEQVEQLYKWIMKLDLPKEHLRSNDREIVITDSGINDMSNIKVAVNKLNIDLTGNEVQLKKEAGKITIKSKNTRVNYQ